MKDIKDNALWVILVPKYKHNSDTDWSTEEEWSVEYHQVWDAKIRKITQGLTIGKTTKGQWVSPNGELFFDCMIPVKITCTENEIKEIVNITLAHYSEEAIMYYKISDHVRIVNNLTE